MNTFSLLLKQMRQRALSTWLTLLSVTLGVALAIAILICQREGQSAFGQTDYGYDLLIGPRGSGLTLVLNTVYHLEQSQGNVSFAEYKSLARRTGTLPEDMATTRPTDPPRNPYPITWVVPYAVGDSYKGFRIVATMPILFGAQPDGTPADPSKTHIPEFRPGERYQLAQGGVFAYNRFQAVIGADVAEATNLKIGDKFQATHGMPKPDEIPDIHDEIWTVVGILDKTYTANDRVLFIPLMSFYAITEHEAGLEAIAKIQGKVPTAPQRESTGSAEEKAYTLNPDGTIRLRLPEEEWEISAILVKTPSFNVMQNLQFVYKNRPETMAVNPALVMTEFFQNILGSVIKMLQVITAVVVVIAAVGILVSIYNSVAARDKEVAILRALGATRGRILTLISLEATLIGAAGGVLGILAGHGAAAVGSSVLAHWIGHGIAWWKVSSMELIYLGVVVAIAFLAGLVPAFKAFRVPVAANLVG